MQRVVVLGPPGSGKSTLARRLGARHGLPVIHLDQLFWQPGWVQTPAEAFHAEVERLSRGPAWVIEGNYTASIACRFAAADTVIYLDVPGWLCTLRILRRTLAGHGQVRPDAAPGCPERLDPDFIRYTWTWNRIRRTRNLALARTFPGRTLILTPDQSASTIDRLLSDPTPDHATGHGARVR